MKHNNLLAVKPSGKGVSLLTGGNATTSYFSGTEMSETRLSIDLKLNNPLFANFTNVSTVNPQRIYYLSNAGNKASGQLTVNTSGVISDQDLLPLRPLLFMQDLPAGFDTAIQLKRMNGESLPAPQPQMHEDGSAVLRINLVGHGAGGYQLMVGDQVTSFYARADGVAPAPFAVMELFCDGAVDGSQIFDNGQTVNRNFQLTFQARAVRWSYIIVPRSFSASEVTMEVTSEETAVDFDGPQNTFDPQQEKAVLFRSKDAIELREKPENLFNLVVNPSNGLNGMKNLNVDLPVPSLTSIGLMESPNDQPFANSNMYVYL